MVYEMKRGVRSEPRDREIYQMVTMAFYLRGILCADALLI